MTYHLTYTAEVDSTRRLEMEVEPASYEEQENARSTYLEALAAVLEAERRTAEDVAALRLRRARESGRYRRALSQASRLNLAAFTVPDDDDDDVPLLEPRPGPRPVE